MMWIILGHTYYVFFLTPIQNATEIYQLPKRLSFQVGQLFIAMAFDLF